MILFPLGPPRAAREGQMQFEIPLKSDHIPGPPSPLLAKA
jgi:hypothetical protein